MGDRTRTYAHFESGASRTSSAACASTTCEILSECRTPSPSTIYQRIELQSRNHPNVRQFVRTSFRRVSQSILTTNPTFVNAHADITAFRTCNWYACQSVGIPTSINSASIFIIAVVVPIVIALVVAAVVVKKLYLKAVQSLSRVLPHPMVQAPPGSQRGPVIAEISANSQAGAVARYEASRNINIPATVSSSAPISGGSTCSIVAQDSLRAMDGPSQVTQLNSLPSVHENDWRSRTSLDAGVGQVDEPPRTVNIHLDGGHAPDVDEAELRGLPPPYWMPVWSRWTSPRGWSHIKTTDPSICPRLMHPY
ncbi:hypothetical protein J3R82DRAFT_9168 [Butyriboletus roseoflavus]|nr:hypothetical protein J3R82DRAFT_9168 [Butyriboletus roseoflavus]